jgi:predicted ester cyclase
MVLFRFANDKVVEAWVNVDIMGLMQQIGVIPAMA